MRAPAVLIVVGATLACMVLVWLAIGESAHAPSVSVDATPPLVDRGTNRSRINAAAPTSFDVLSVARRAVGGMKLSWGYASSRNEARWAIMAPVVVEAMFDVARSTAAPSGAFRCPAAPGANSLFSPPLVAIDYGADQGYFSVALAVAAREVVAALCPQSPISGAASPSAASLVLAVEKGGVGGSLWVSRRGAQTAPTGKQRSPNNGHLDVHLRIRDGAARFGVASSVRVCPVEVTAATWQQWEDVSVATSGGSPARCGASVQLALSMLHWVSGLDTRDAFLRGIGDLAAKARLTVVELPHPAARRTFGEKRYRAWYRGDGRENVTALLAEAAAVHCPACRVRLLGRTAWGDPRSGLYRELHAIWNGGSKQESGSGGLAQCGACCVEMLHCPPQ